MTLSTEIKVKKKISKKSTKKPVLMQKKKRLTLAAALHMSATILPDTRVSKMLVVAKLNTFSRATCWNNTTWLQSVQAKLRITESKSI